MNIKFGIVETDENYDMLKYASEDGGWELGFYKVMFGIRIRMGITGEQTIVLDYCAGSDTEDQLGILECVMNIMEQQEVGFAERDVHKLFPVQTVKPMFNDPDCWNKLKQIEFKLKANV